jgi:hypothetical protein
VVGYIPLFKNQGDPRLETHICCGAFTLEELSDLARSPEAADMLYSLLRKEDDSVEFRMVKERSNDQ